MLKDSLLQILLGRHRRKEPTVERPLLLSLAPFLPLSFDLLLSILSLPFSSATTPSLPPRLRFFLPRIHAMATTTSSTKSGLFRSLTSKLVRKDEEGGTSLKPQRAGTLRSKAREQMRTGRPAVDHDARPPSLTIGHDARPPSLTIGDDGWGSDGKVSYRRADELELIPPLPSPSTPSSLRLLLFHRSP